MVSIPSMQKFIGAKASSIIGKELGTSISIGKVQVGFLNRIILDDIVIYDQDSQPMISSSRVAARIDYYELLKKMQLYISSAQLFGFQGNFYKVNETSQANYQFLLDSLSSGSTNSNSNLKLRINSLIIRNGKLKYDRKDLEKSSSKFSLEHLDFRDISANIAVPYYTSDSLSIAIKRFSLKEASSLDLKNLSFSLELSKSGALISDFNLSLPKTNINIPSIKASYSLLDNKELDKNSLFYQATLGESQITLSDVSFLIPEFQNFTSGIDITGNISGGYDSFSLTNLNLYSQDGLLKLIADGEISNISSQLNVNANIGHLSCDLKNINEKLSSANSGSYNIPKIITNLGEINYNGLLSKNGTSYIVDGALSSEIGNLDLNLRYNEGKISANIETPEVNFSHLIDDDRFGLLSSSINVQCELKGNTLSSINLDGNLKRFDFMDYSYGNIEVKGSFEGGVFDGFFSLDDPNAEVLLNGTLDTKATGRKSNLKAQIRNLNPSKLKLTQQFQDASFDFDLEANTQISGNSLNDIIGEISLSNFNMRSSKDFYNLESLYVDINQDHLLLDGDFGRVQIRGNYDLSSIKESIFNLVSYRLPSLITSKNKSSNNFSIEATITSSSLLNALFDIPLTLNSPLSITGEIVDSNHYIDLKGSALDFSYNGSRYKNMNIYSTCYGDSLIVNAQVKRMNDDRQGLDIDVSLSALDDKVLSSLKWDNHQKTPIKGQLNTKTNFIRTLSGKPGIILEVEPSQISVNDTLWRVQPSSISYLNETLEVDHFSIEHNRQHVKISGKATKSEQDSITIDLQDVDVKYVLDLVNFHTVDFKGYASGNAYIKSVFVAPRVTSDLKVKDFKFQDGRMGVLSAKVNFENDEKKIVIDALTQDKDSAKVFINGYVSLKEGFLNLDIKAINTNIEFLESFCSSFMDNVQATTSGDLKISGPLGDINLTGKVVADGSLRIKPLNTTYRLQNDTINFIPDNIIFSSDTIIDRNGNIGIVTGALKHEHLTNLSYGVMVEARNLLCFDTHSFGDDTFYGTVYGTGNCSISGRSGRVDIDINLTPEKDSFIEYNASSPDQISGGDFISWRNATLNEDSDSLKEVVVYREEDYQLKETSNSFWKDFPSDIRVSLVINTNPEATLRVLMDEASNDYIALNGTGVITASYFNKGSFNMFGTYLIDHGEYKLTIQNIIRKVFSFQEGGSIVFTGDPYNATLNLQAVYTINSVPLSDLQMGSSFSSNNVRVDCLMNITGTPFSPHVDFDINLPTVSSDAEQMIRTVINSEQEMNQQVVYLLGIGRFYIQGGNNSNTQTSQTSLAMQSFLSGTLSQQINSILSSLVKNNNWTFGANISTGTEGFYNAEYEGLLSGHLLNNRLIINGQFGYRDNANATSSFIGDFDINYLLLPSGSIALKVYNQTNDRYFTKSSLNTQGIGIVMKKDFNKFKDMFKSSKKKKKKKKNKEDILNADSISSNN